MSRKAKLTCQEAVEHVTGYLESALLPELDAEFEAHLTTCPGCHTYLDQMRQTIHLLRELTGQSLSVEAQAQALEKFRAWQKMNIQLPGSSS